LLRRSRSLLPEGWLHRELVVEILERVAMRVLQ
jgi:hypothetical protein